jgi:hypothetical protein
VSITFVSAHIAGVPVEETIAQLAPIGFAVVLALSQSRERARRWKIRHKRQRAPASRRSSER